MVFCVPCLFRLWQKRLSPCVLPAYGCFHAPPEVALSKPFVSARGFAQAWEDLIGSRERGCSRITIDHIRNAFVGYAADFVHQEARCKIRRCASTSQAGVPYDGGVPAFTCALLHIHDEAALRLRSVESTDSAAAAPERSRGSKVQQHAVWLHPAGSGEALPMMIELDALGGKSAVVIATSILRVLREAASLVEVIIARQMSSL